jgi:hypothetical protein
MDQAFFSDRCCDAVSGAIDFFRRRNNSSSAGSYSVIEIQLADWLY